MSMKVKVVALLTLLMFIGSGILCACGGTEPSVNLEKGPYMLYFYAKW